MSDGNSQNSHERHREHHPHKPVNLRRMFPLAIRSIIRESLPYLLLLIVLSILGQAIYVLGPANPTITTQVFQTATVWIWLTGAGIVLVKFLYQFLIHVTYRYGVELENIIIVKGVFFRTRVSIPLTKMIDITMERDPVDMIFFLYNLYLRTASDLTDSAAVRGLSWKNAIGLQNYILALLNTIEPAVDHDAAQETLEEASSRFEGLEGSIPRPPPISNTHRSPEQRSVHSENRPTQDKRSHFPGVNADVARESVPHVEDELTEELETRLDQAEQDLHVAEQEIADVREQLDEIQK